MRLNKSHLMASTGLESILHQDTLFFKQVVQIFAKLMKQSNISQTVLKRSGLEELTKKRTHIAVELQWNTSDAVNAHMVPPMLDGNHPLFHPLMRAMTNSTDTMKLIHSLEKRVLTGYVDREKAVVGGDFEKVAMPISLYRGLFSQKLLTAEQIAAIYIHELGHAFTYFECLSDAFTLNYAIVAVTKAFLGTTDQKQKVLLLREVDQKLGIEIEDKEYLASKSVDVVISVIITDAIRRKKSANGTELYDTRTWEALSDQFCSRMGGGQHLASALDVIYRKHSKRTYWSDPVYYISEVLRVTGIIVLMLLTLKFAMFGKFIGICLMLLSNPYTDTYDRPAERITRIREDIASRLMDKSLTADEKKRTLEELKFIDGLIADMKDRYTFWQWVWRTVYPKVGTQVNRMENYKELESLANNNLYVHAATLSTLR